MMVNQNEKFQQRWEFRRGGDDEDSSTDDDSKSLSHQVDKKHSMVNHLLLRDDDEEVSDAQGDKIDTNDHVVPLRSVEVAKKKVKSNKKEKKNIVVPKKSMRSLVVAKGNKKRKRNLVPKEMVMLDDLKAFADSLLHEVKVAREDMSAKMRKLVASRPRKKKTQNGSSVERSVKSNVTSDASNVPKGAKKYDRMQDEVQKGKKLNLSKRAHMVLATDADRIVSSPFLPPKPQLLGHENGITLNDRIPHTMDAEYCYQFGHFPRTSSKNIDFLGQTCTQTLNDVGFHPNMSSETCSENSFRDKSGESQRGNSATLKFSGGNMTALSEYVLGNSIRSNVQRHRPDGEFVPLRLQELKNDQVYQLGSLRNKQSLFS